jgi:hypothetical protein
VETRTSFKCTGRRKFAEMKGPVLLPTDVERLVESLQPIKLEDVGGKVWSRQHQTLEKLNMQVCFVFNYRISFL